jgi:hypothetical protein
VPIDHAPPDIHWLQLISFREVYPGNGKGRFWIMPSERVVEIPWALQQLPQKGCILDIGSCEANYLSIVWNGDRILHCMDPRDCEEVRKLGVPFHNQSVIGNTLPDHSYDGVLLISTIEHIGLWHYGQRSFPLGDQLTLFEVGRLLKPGSPLIMTVPAGISKVASWYRQYSPSDLKRLFKFWEAEFFYWGFNEEQGEFEPISEEQVEQFDYRGFGYGAGAVAGIKAVFKTGRKDR